jgi:HSP20 family protein
MEVFETDDEIHVRAEVPGIDPKDLNIQLVGDMLVLSGEKKEEEEQRGARTYSERSYGAFRRALRLSTPVDADHVKAEHRHGVVMIQLTKSESVRPKRIQIKSS